MGTQVPTQLLTQSPTAPPTLAPTPEQTLEPTSQPTPKPTQPPTRVPSPTSRPTHSVKWVVGIPGKHEGKSCDTICEEANSVCDKPDGTHFDRPPLTRKAMNAVAHEAGVTCPQVSSRCDMGESPIHSSAGCFFCDHPQSYHHRCAARAANRIRFCPCLANGLQSLPTPAPSPPHEFQ